MVKVERDDREVKRLLSEIKEQGQVCPDFVELAEFLDGGLDTAEEEKIRSHLANCSSCLEKVRIGLRLEDEVTGSADEAILNLAKSLFKPTLIQRFKSLLKYIIKDRFLTKGQISTEPAFAFRGISPARVSLGLNRYFQEFGPYKAEVEVEEIEKGKWQIGVFVEERDGNKPVKGIRVSISDYGQILESLILEDGKAVFEPVFQGRYQIGFHSRGCFLGGLSINLKGDEK